MPIKFLKQSPFAHLTTFFGCLFCLISGALVMISGPSHAQPHLRCAAAFSSPRASGERDVTGPIPPKLGPVLDLLFQKNSDGKRHLLELWHSPAFAQYLREQGLDAQWTHEVPAREPFHLVANYVDFFMKAFRNESLYEHLREQALASRLRLHGYRVDTTRSARENLAQLSQQNLDRVLGERYQSQPEMRELEIMVNRLELFLAHNSTIMRTPPSYPVLAPKALEGMGLTKFAASSKEFNRALGSTDFVYFFVALKVRDSQVRLRSEYGDYGVVVEDAYARKQAWISPFIMHPNQIGFAVESLRPDLASRILRERQPDPALLNEALPYLHAWDFTFADFAQLFRERLLLGAQELRRQHPNKFHEFQMRFKNFVEQAPNPKPGFPVIPAFLWDLAFPRRQFPARFEGRIPIAVPERYLIHFAQ